MIELALIKAAIWLLEVLAVACEFPGDHPAATLFADALADVVAVLVALRRAS